MPWPLVAYGMYGARSIVLTFFLYHAVCLLPAVIVRRNLWLRNWRLPTARDWLAIVVAAVLTSMVALFAYRVTGTTIVSRSDVMQVLTLRGFNAAYLWPFSAYFIIVNATLEELFWRGVVLNDLDSQERNRRKVGYAWAVIAFGAWHYLVLRALLRPGFAELAVLLVVAMGILCSWLYRRSGSIIVAIAWHALVFDLAIIVLLVDVLRV